MKKLFILKFCTIITAIFTTNAFADWSSMYHNITNKSKLPFLKLNMWNANSWQTPITSLHSATKYSDTTGCTFLDENAAHIAGLTLGQTAPNQNDYYNDNVGPYNVVPAWCDIMNDNSDPDIQGLFSYQIINAAGQTTIVTFSSEADNYYDSQTMDNLLAGNIAQKATIDGGGNQHHTISIINNIQISANEKNNPYGNWKKGINLSELYLGQYGADRGKKNGSDIYKFTIQHPDYVLLDNNNKLYSLNTEYENDNNDSSNKDYVDYPTRGQNFSIIFSPYAVEGSADGSTWYHLGYVLPQGMPGHGGFDDPNLAAINPGDSTFYFSPQAMKSPDNIQFKYIRVLQTTFLRDSGEHEATISEIITLPDNPTLPPITGGTSHINNPNGGGTAFYYNANSIAQTQLDYTVAGLSSDQNILAPKYTYFTESTTGAENIGFLLKDQAYLITNFYDPNNIYEINNDDHFNLIKGNISKQNYIAITDQPGQYVYNPPTRYNSKYELIAMNAAPAPITYYISSGIDSSSAVKSMTMYANNPEAQQGNFTVNFAENSAGHFTAGQNRPITTGARDDNGHAWEFQQNLELLPNATLYNPQPDINQTAKAISYLYYADNDPADTLTCNETGKASGSLTTCNRHAPYTVVMNKYLALLWVEANSANLSIKAYTLSYSGPYGISYSHTAYDYSSHISTLPNPNFAACPIKINNNNFITGGAAGETNNTTCFDVNMDHNPPKNHSGHGGGSDFYWFGEDPFSAKDNSWDNWWHYNAERNPANITATITDSFGDVLIVNGDYLPTS